MLALLRECTQKAILKWLKIKVREGERAVWIS